MKSFRVFIFAIFLSVILTLSVSAGGNKEVPDLEVSTSGTQYISPDGNGVQDSAELAFKVKIYVKSKAGYIPEYGLRIKNSAGNTVTEVVEKEKSDINWFIRIFTKYSEFTLEKTVAWNGLDTAGNKVPDGIYNVEIWVKDASGNIDEVDIDDFVVDIVPPSVELVKPDKMIFSPNNDGNLDVFVLKQEKSTEEVLWTGEVVDKEGETVKTFKWENRSLPSLEWDGLDNSGKRADDGVYSYRINSTDLSGNKMDEKSVSGIVLDTTMADVIFELSDTYFSPNNDGSKDTIIATFGQKTEKGLIAWSVTMADAGGNVILSDKGTEPGIYEAVIDGKGEQGENLSQGSYTLGFSSEYENGVRIVKTETVYLDTTSPVVDFRVSNPVFSPNGNGSRDTTEISMKSNKIVKWKGQITDSSGSSVGEMSSKDTTSLIVWDGTDENGSELPDGDYYLETYFEDLAGNPYVPSKQRITIDRIEKKAELVNIPGAEMIEKNIEGIAAFSVDSDDMDGIEMWSFRVSDPEGNVLYEESGKGSLPDTVTVPGSRDEAEEGNYNVSFTAVYENGSRSEHFFKYFYDLTPPEADLVISATPFAVNGEVLDGEVYIDPNAEDESGIYKWILKLKDGNGEEDSSEGKELSEEGIVVYGENYIADEVASGSRFDVELELVDMNGNSTVVNGDFEIDIIAELVDGRYYIKVPKIIFSAYKDTLYSRGKAAGDENMETVRKVAELSRKYPDYQIVLEGHALNVFHGRNDAKEAKEEKVLVPLTERRALSVKKALIAEGLPEERIRIEYFGGKRPETSVTDKSVRWKNRRVEFAIDRD